MQADRSLRSVFVGNIPYDATEEKLRDIFSAVGPVLSFRIVFDRETGKPKGYGFCEYKDQETATSAIRNLNGHDLGGRQLRVDSASNERARDEPDTAPAANDNQMQHQLQHQAPPVPEPLVDAQTLINNVMCSLQPEQLFDLCKQLKTSLLVNPNETRQLLIQNPQLSYAILQSLVMIKAIDAQTAMNTLHAQLMQPAPLQPTMPMMAPMGPPLGGPVMGGPQAPPGAGPMVMQPQPIPSATPVVMQPQVMNPYAFMGPQPMIATSTAAAVPPMPQPVGITTMSAPSAAPADPRLARQQQQHQQQQQQAQHQQQSHTGMSEQERQAFLMQVVNMTDQEISLLPPDQQDKIYLLRRQYMPSAMSQ